MSIPSANKLTQVSKKYYKISLLKMGWVLWKKFTKNTMRNTFVTEIMFISYFNNFIMKIKSML